MWSPVLETTAAWTTGRDKPVPYALSLRGRAPVLAGVGATLVIARVGNDRCLDNGTGQARPLRRLSLRGRAPVPPGVGATLVVAALETTAAWTTGRDKPVPYAALSLRGGAPVLAGVGATLVVARVGNDRCLDNGTGQARPLRPFPARTRPGTRRRRGDPCGRPCWKRPLPGQRDGTSPSPTPPFPYAAAPRYSPAWGRSFWSPVLESTAAWTTGRDKPVPYGRESRTDAPRYTCRGIPGKYR